MAHLWSRRRNQKAKSFAEILLSSTQRKETNDLWNVMEKVKAMSARNCNQYSSHPQQNEVSTPSPYWILKSVTTFCQTHIQCIVAGGSIGWVKSTSLVFTPFERVDFGLNMKRFFKRTIRFIVRMAWMTLTSKYESQLTQSGEILQTDFLETIRTARWML